jgi:uncharacterized protein (DUF1810 family)
MTDSHQHHADPSDEQPFDLQRFVAAQAPVYAQVIAELRAGRKRTHWMWFIFPQIRGLGSSPTAQHYAIASLDEARAYLAHPVLGPRLIECTTLVLQHAATAKPSTHPESGQEIIDEIFGYPDNLKVHSSMTLFARAAATTPAGNLSVADDPALASVFQQALQSFFAGQSDPATLRLL